MERIVENSKRKLQRVQEAFWTVKNDPHAIASRNMTKVESHSWCQAFRKPITNKTCMGKNSVNLALMFYI